MTRTLVVSGLLLTVGCTRDPGSESDPSTTPSTTDGSSADTSATGVVDPTTGPSTDPGGPGSETGVATTAGTGEPSTTGDTGCDFICGTTGGGVVGEDCDVFDQDDCGVGMKCAAWSDGDIGWNASKCVPVTGEGAPGDSCLTMGGVFSGLDDCQKGAMCWETDDMMMGTCVELCQGTPDAPICSEGGPCSITHDGVINLCLPPCDPLGQGCPDAEVCVPLMDGFGCTPDASGDGGASYSPCEFANACDQGNFCGDPKLAPMNCDLKAIGCCIPFCNLDEMPGCAGVKTTCEPYYEEGMAPTMQEKIGACVE